MRLTVRADGDARIGTGHIMRCLALAEVWPGTVTFASCSLSDGLRRRIETAGHRVRSIDATLGSLEDAAATTRLAGAHDALVLDGYGLPHAAQDAAVPSLVVDDGGRVGHYACALVTDPSLDAPRDKYGALGARVLAGPRYALVRRGVVDRRPKVPGARPGPLLVSLGGNAPLPLWRAVIEGIRLAGTDDVHILLGGTQEDADQVRALAAPPWRVEQDLADLGAALAEARLAILAGGSTNWEACVTGTPRIVVQTADNQAGVANAMARQGAGIDLGWHEDLDPSGVASALTCFGDDARLDAMARAAWELCDGKGAHRVVAHLMARCLHVRCWGPDDARLIFAWANDPATRRNAFHQGPIPWSDHEAWFARRLEDDGCMAFVLEADGVPVGQVRLDARPGQWEISIGVAPERRGGRLAPAMLVAALDAVPEDRRMPVAAFIREENVASQRAFATAGFTCDAVVDKDGTQAQRWMWSGP